MSDRQFQRPEPLKEPRPGFELCHECEGDRYCSWCLGQGVFDDGERCIMCSGNGLCPICYGRGELPAGSREEARAPIEAKRRQEAGLPPAEVPSAYSFSSPLSREALLAALNGAGPWQWSLRDDHHHGSYLRASPERSESRLRIFGEGPDYLLDVDYDPGVGYHRLARDELDRAIRYRILPAAQAENVRPAVPRRD